MPANDGTATLDQPCALSSSLPVLARRGPSRPAAAFASGAARVTHGRAASGGRRAVRRYRLRSGGSRSRASVARQRNGARSVRDRPSGRWGPWRAAAARAGGRTRRGLAESRRAASWRVGNPWWVGASNGIEAGASATSRASGRASSGARRFVSPTALRRRCPRPGSPRSCRAPAGTRTSRSDVLRRATRRRCELAIIHHTAGQNDYTRAQAPAIVRGIELFHVKGNGWNDIGYNFLVDRFGTVYEGRYGGRRPQCDRRPRARLQHRLGRDRAARDVRQHEAVRRSARRDRAARLLEARSRARRSDVVPHVHLGRQRALPERRPGAVERGVGPSRHGLDGVPGRRAVREARRRSRPLRGRSAGRRSSIRGRTRRRHRSASAPGCRRRSRGRSSSPAQRARRSRAGPAPVPPSTGRGSGAASRPATYSWTISAGTARPATGVLRAGGGAAPPCARRPVCRARRDQPERRRPGGHGDRHVPAVRSRERDGRGRRRARHGAGDRGGPRLDARRADIR